MRELLYQINSKTVENVKQDLGFLELGPKKKENQKYFTFPSEILYAHIKKYGLKIVHGSKVELQSDV